MASSTEAPLVVPSSVDPPLLLPATLARALSNIDAAVEGFKLETGFFMVARFTVGRMEAGGSSAVLGFGGGAGFMEDDEFDVPVAGAWCSFGRLEGAAAIKVNPPALMGCIVVVVVVSSFRLAVVVGLVFFPIIIANFRCCSMTSISF
jgi:hypothetical protein